eukprot:s4_g31.t1
MVKTQLTLIVASYDSGGYKGIIAFERDGTVVRYVLQGVHDMVDIAFSGEWPAEKPLRTQVVLIGRNLDKEELQESINRCALLPDTV